MSGVFASKLAALPSQEERLVDAALLAVFNLRDKLVHLDRNHEACRVDEAMEILEQVARGVVRPCHQQEKGLI